MKRFAGRGKADSLSVAQCQALEKDLQAWIDTERQAERTWRFGMYGEMHERRDILKMAPDIEDLLMNRSLWKLLLSYFPSGKFKDKYLADIMNSLLERSMCINDTKMTSTSSLGFASVCTQACLTSGLWHFIRKSLRIASASCQQTKEHNWKS